MINITLNMQRDAQLSKKKEDLSFLFFTKNKENSESLLRKKRNNLFKIEKNFENNSILRKEISVEERRTADKINLTSTTNLSKESGKNYKKMHTKENLKRKKIREKNLLKLYSINNSSVEEKFNFKKENSNISDLTKRDFLKQIKTKKNFITLNKQLSSNYNFAKINFIPDCLTLNNKNNENNFNNIIKIKNNLQIKRKTNINLAKNCDYSCLAIEKENCFPNLSKYEANNLSLLENQNSFSQNKKKDINLNGNKNKFNNYNLKQTADSISLKFINFTYLNLNLFEQSELYSERIENIQNFIDQKAKEKINDEKNNLLQLKKLKELNQSIEEAEKIDNSSVEFTNLINIDNENKLKFDLKEKMQKNNVEIIVNYECAFSHCDKSLSTLRDWETHYQEHIKS
jgi:hypothetical protein